MMNKRLIILFICLAVLVLTVVLGAVVFTISDIEVLVSGNNGEKLDSAKIVVDSKIKLKSSIFALSEKTAVTNIELSNPYAKVISIERHFPNKVIINVAYRTPIIAIKLDDNVNCVIVDREFKILEIVNKDDLKIYNLTSVEGFIISGLNMESAQGQTIDCSKGDLKILYDCVKALEELSFINERIPAFVKTISLNTPKYAILETVFGIKLALKTNTNIDLPTQFRSIYSFFDKLTDLEKQDDSLFIYLGDKSVIMSTTLN